MTHIDYIQLLKMEELDHFIYPKAKLEEADAVAWVFPDPKADLVMYPFKFFPLEPSDVRLKVLHTSLCHSDLMHARGYWGTSFLMQATKSTPAVPATKSWGR
jgi:NADPH:quinone reductase-like Zn-dependent oxidoreductase